MNFIPLKTAPETYGQICSVCNVFLQLFCSNSISSSKVNYLRMHCDLVNVAIGGSDYTEIGNGSLSAENVEHQ